MTGTLSLDTIRAIADAVVARLRADRAGVHTLAEPIPTVCSIADLCRILQMSRRSLDRARSRGSFPIPEIEPRLGPPRFSGAMVQAYLDGRAMPAHKRRRKR
jgi:hypothetical protein